MESAAEVQPADAALKLAIMAMMPTARPTFEQTRDG
jgi:hypothetical protein